MTQLYIFEKTRCKTQVTKDINHTRDYFKKSSVWTPKTDSEVINIYIYCSHVQRALSECSTMGTSFFKKLCKHGSWLNCVRTIYFLEHHQGGSTGVLYAHLMPSFVAAVLTTQCIYRYWTPRPISCRLEIFHKFCIKKIHVQDVSELGEWDEAFPFP